MVEIAALGVGYEAILLYWGRSTSHRWAFLEDESCEAPPRARRSSPHGQRNASIFGEVEESNSCEHPHHL